MAFKNYEVELLPDRSQAHRLDELLDADGRAEVCLRLDDVLSLYIEHVGNIESRDSLREPLKLDAQPLRAVVARSGKHWFLSFTVVVESKAQSQRLKRRQLASASKP